MRRLNTVASQKRRCDRGESTLWLASSYLEHEVSIQEGVKNCHFCLSVLSKMKAHSEKSMNVTSDVKMTDENDFLSRSMMNQSEEHHHEGANLDQSCHSTKIICYFKEDQSEFLEERRQKDLVNEFASVTTSEFMSR